MTFGHTDEGGARRSGGGEGALEAGGGDENRSGSTFRVLLVTEADKMDQPGESSREADAVTQGENRGG